MKTPKLVGDRRREEGKVIERNKRVNKMFRFGVGRKKEEKKSVLTPISHERKNHIPPNL